MLGEKVSTLTEETQDAGRHAYNLRASQYELSAGMYLLKISVGEQSISRRLVKLGN
jgi:hypothetical protein